VIVIVIFGKLYIRCALGAGATWNGGGDIGPKGTGDVRCMIMDGG
jgi:hypothetical protein